MKTELASKLGAMGLFTEFTEPEITTLAELAEPCSFQKGERIVAQDSAGDAMFIIVEGAVKVVHRTDDTGIELARLGAGEFFGELALVDHSPRCADVDAVEDCVLLRIPQSSVLALAGVYPNAAFKFLIAVGRVLVKRMRFGNQKYIDSLLVGSGHGH
jgi:CRP-like cAMP-binding protein